MKDARVAKQRWEAENLIKQEEELYRFDQDEADRINEARPWRTDPNYFKKVRISAVALIKIVMHARSGGNLEVMGLLQGKVKGREFIVMDSFALPVEGTETRVNALASANEYMVNYATSGESVGRLEGVCGWYHSHPGYGCWMSGIDVNTQMSHQMVEDPYLAIVIDPVRTISSGKVEIGCFRAYPQNYTPPEQGTSQYQHIPLSKIEDFGVHYKHYYTVEHSFFKSALDEHILEQLWHKYWVQTLSSSSIVANRDYITANIVDVSEKVDQVETVSGRMRGGIAERKEESQLQKVSRDAEKTGVETGQALVALLLKKMLFNQLSSS